MEGNSCAKRTLEPNCDVDEYCGSKAKRSKSDSCLTQDIITQMNQMFQQFVLSSKSVPLHVFQPLRPHLHIIARNRNPILNFLLSLTWSNSQSEEYLATLAALVYDLVVMKPQLIRELFNNIFLQYLKGKSESQITALHSLQLKICARFAFACRSLVDSIEEKFPHLHSPPHMFENLLNSIKVIYERDAPFCIKYFLQKMLTASNQSFVFIQNDPLGAPFHAQRLKTGIELIKFLTAKMSLEDAGELSHQITEVLHSFIGKSGSLFIALCYYELFFRLHASKIALEHLITNQNAIFGLILLIIQLDMKKATKKYFKVLSKSVDLSKLISDNKLMTDLMLEFVHEDTCFRSSKKMAKFIKKMHLTEFIAEHKLLALQADQSSLHTDSDSAEERVTRVLKKIRPGFISIA